MKITFTILLAGLCACFSLRASAQPRVLTLDNKAGAVAMFTTLQAAYNAARDGDTIMVAGSPTKYSTSMSLYKRINIIGPGYFLAGNNILGVVKDAADIGSINIRRDAVLGNGSGSTFSGVTISNFGGISNGDTWAAIDHCYVGSVMTPSTSRVDISRSWIGDVSLNSSGNNIRNSIISLAAQVQGVDITISGCVVRNLYTSGSPTSSTISISNSILIQPPGEGDTLATFSAFFKGSITHSIAVGDSSVASGRRSFLPEGGGNLNGFNLTDVFVSSGTEDGKWKLKEGSPAIGTGYAGTDIGIFGGGNPYILSGVPPRPRITRLVVPAATTQETGLRFEVDAKAH